MGLFSFLFGTTRRAGPRPPTEKAPPPARRPSDVQSAQRPTTGAHVQWREGSFPMEVVGESNYQATLVGICGSHTRYGHEGEYVAAIALEPTNRFDPNAVMVTVQGQRVGYLAREQAVRVGQLMREAGLSSAACGARIRGGWRTNQHDEGHYGVTLAIPRTGWIDFGIGAQPPVRERAKPVARDRPTPAASGPLLGQFIALIGAPPDGALAKELAKAGAHVMAAPGKSTTLFVVAAERPFDFGMRRSAKFEKAETLIAGGSPLKIVSLSEVRAMASGSVGR